LVSDAAAPAFLGVERSLGGRRWLSRVTDDALALALAQALEVPDVVGRVLAARNVRLDDAETYLNPTLRATMPDPSRLRDMDRAVARLADALSRDEPIAVFGDYDVDGATASALLRLYLEAVGGRVRPYIPDRLREGYGPNPAALARLREEGASVVVTVDCGTTSHAALAAARDVGLDVIVVDHHQAGPDLPPAIAVVNPNRLDESGDLGMLAAVGVTFMLVVALNRALTTRGWFAGGDGPDLKQWLDLVALGTVCDLVPLVGLNRALVRQGLKVLARRSNPGLAALADVAGIDEPPGTYHLGYVLGPRINAGGRVGEANLGHRLLTSGSAPEALPLAERLQRLNEERKAIETRVLEEAQRVAEAVVSETTPVVVVAGEGWHVGVIGLVASRLVERFARPSVVVALDGEVGKGSARSLPGVDIGTIVTAARQAGLLVNGGGHPMAAGLTVERAKLDALAAFLERRVAAPGGRQPSLGLDGALSVGGATRELCDVLARAGPYGSGNPEPRFAIAQCRIEYADVVGNGHVRCRLADGHGARVKAIAFRAADRAVGQALLAAAGRALHVAGHLREDNWKRRAGVQVVIDDVAVVERPTAGATRTLA
jgi:single-stranded-DNA-specific exonuclease